MSMTGQDKDKYQSSQLEGPPMRAPSREDGL